MRYFSGQVHEGRVELDDKIGWAAFLGHLNDKRVILSLEPAVQRDRRSNQANRWYRGVIVPMCAAYFSVGRIVPISPDQAHDVLARSFYGVEETPIGSVRKKTSLMDSKEFAEYCDKIVAHMETEWKMSVPRPGQPNEADI